MSIGVKCLSPRPMATLRLLCVPFAGGGALSFRGWAQQLPGGIEAFAVQLPGREDRLREPAIVEWAVMMRALVEALSPLPPMPTAIFGHSLGAVIALELARWMQLRHPTRLRHVFASGRPWPGGRDAGSGPVRELSDDELLDMLDRQYGSLSTSLAHPDIRELALPALRADLRLLDSYPYVQAPPLECPLTVFAGSADPATSVENLAGWASETRGPFRKHVLEGSHFFIETAREQLLDVVSRELAVESGYGIRVAAGR